MRLVYDIEGNGLYAKVHTVHCIRAYDIDTNTMYRFDKDHEPIFRGIKLLNEADELIGHNIIGFDNPALRKLFPKFTNWNAIKQFDTIVASKLVFANIMNIDNAKVKAGKMPSNLVGNHGLKAWGYRLDEYKGEYGARLKGESEEDYTRRVWSKYSKEMGDYCEQDVMVNVELYWKIQERMIKNCVPEEALNIEFEFAKLISRQERHGVWFDIDKAEALEKTLLEESAKSMDILEETYTPRYFCDRPAKAGESWIPCNMEDAGELTKTERANKKTGKTDVTYQNLQGVKYKFIDGQFMEQVRIAKVKRSKTIEVPCKDGGTKSLKTTNIVKGAVYSNIVLESFSPTSGRHIIRWLKEMFDWTPTEFTEKGGVKVDGDTLAVLTFDGIESLQRFQMISKRLSQLSEGKGALLRHYNSESHRINGRCDTLGAVTRRCTHSSPNLAQVPSNTAEYGKDFRSLFTTPKGYTLVGADGSGLELRTLSHYLWYYDEGAYGDIVLSGDIHWKNTQDVGFIGQNVKRDKHNAEHDRVRGNAKTFIYAFLYGAGASKLGETVMPNGTAKQKESAGKKMKSKFMKANPSIATLIKEVKDRSEKRKFVIDLTGNRLYIRSVHSAPNMLLQSCGAIIMKYWLVEVENMLQEMGYENTDDVKHTDRPHDYEFVLNVHDEAQIEVRNGLEEEVARICEEAFITVGRALDVNILIEGEAQIGKDWSETH